MEGGLGIREDKRAGLQAVLTVTGQSGAGEVLSGMPDCLAAQTSAGSVWGGYISLPHGHQAQLWDTMHPPTQGEEYILEYVQPRTVI